MTDRDALLALADRVEALAGPDREVDAIIQRALGDDTTGHWFADRNGAWVTDALAPIYTASLDAAMTLAPNAYRVRLGRLEDGRGSAWVYPPTAGPADEWARLAATPALALCAASLRALAGERG